MKTSQIVIDVFKGELRGNFGVHQMGEEPYSIDPIGISCKEDFYKFKKWVGNIMTLLEKTAMKQDEDSPWGDFSLSRVEKGYKKSYGNKMEEIKEIIDD